MVSNILVLDAHPDPDTKRLVHALADSYAESARQSGAQVRTIRLCDLPIEFLRANADFATAPSEPAILSAREDFTWAEHLVFIFPLWLGDMPALLKAFLEQIARGGFALGLSESGFPKPMLTGKSARLIVTMGMPAFVYSLWFGAHGARALASSVLNISGVKPVRKTLLGGVGAPGAADKAVAKCRALGQARA